MKRIAFASLFLLAACSQPEKEVAALACSLKSVDADSCVYAMDSADSRSGAGIFIGQHPMTEEANPVRSMTGSIGSIPVKWDVLDGQSDYVFPCYRRCLLTYQPADAHEPVVLHAWVYARTEAEAIRIQESLGKLDLNILVPQALAQAAQAAKASQVDQG